jgi:hypothetical protein
MRNPNKKNFLTREMVQAAAVELDALLLSKQGSGERFVRIMHLSAILETFLA